MLDNRGYKVANNPPAQRLQFAIRHSQFAIYFVLFAALLFGSACRPPQFNPKKTALYSPIVEIQTDSGSIEIQLFASTPRHRDNFVKLIRENYYNGILFHRVIPSFMIQSGDPDSRGAEAGKMLGLGGPNYTLPAEIVDDLIHTRGTVAAARMPDNVNPKKESSGSQFYIVQGAAVSDQLLDRVEEMRNFKYSSAQRELYKKLGGTPHLDREYTVFGTVLSGMEVVDKITRLPTDGNNRPRTDLKIIKIRIKKG